MKRKQLAIGLITATIVFIGCNNVPNTGKADLKNQLDSVSYALGFYEASNWKDRIQQTPFDTLDYATVAKAFKNSELVESYIDYRKDQFDTLNVEMFKKGFLNEVAYDKSYFDDISADIYIRTVLKRIKNRKDSITSIKGQENLKKGNAFLEENAKKEDVVSLESGLQYKIIEEGDGKVPSSKDLVKCMFHGTLIDGTVFESTIEQGDTTQFRINKVIKGWQEALTMMPEGSKWKLFIPAHLAYGENGAGEDIGPNETVIFDIELVEVVDTK